MVKIFKKLWETITFPLSTSKEKMQKEYRDLDIVGLWLICYVIICTTSFLLKQNMVDTTSLLYSAVELLILFACIGIIHMSLELIGNYRRAKVRKNLK